MQFDIFVMFLGLPDDIHEEKLSFLRFKKHALQTDRRTDRPSYRDARTHLKIGLMKWFYRFISKDTASYQHNLVYFSSSFIRHSSSPWLWLLSPRLCHSRGHHVVVPFSPQLSSLAVSRSCGSNILLCCQSAKSQCSRCEVRVHLCICVFITHLMLVRNTPCRHLGREW